MLDRLFPSLYGKSESGTSLSSGGSPEALQGNEKNMLSHHASLPTNPTQKDVDSVASDAGQIEARVALLKTYSEHALNAQASALAALDVRINHSGRAMQNEQQYRKKIAKQGKQVLEHRIDVSATRANLDGYQQALNNASSNVVI